MPWYVRATRELGLPTVAFGAMLWFFMTRVDSTLVRVADLEAMQVESERIIVANQNQIIGNQRQIIDMLDQHARATRELGQAMTTALCVAASRDDMQRARCFVDGRR